MLRALLMRSASVLPGTFGAGGNGLIAPIITPFSNLSMDFLGRFNGQPESSYDSNKADSRNHKFQFYVGIRDLRCGVLYREIPEHHEKNAQRYSPFCFHCAQ
jgi:hypothetical protein